MQRAIYVNDDCKFMGSVPSDVCVLCVSNNIDVFVRAVKRLKGKNGDINVCLGITDTGYKIHDVVLKEAKKLYGFRWIVAYPPRLLGFEKKMRGMFVNYDNVYVYFPVNLFSDEVLAEEIERVVSTSLVFQEYRLVTVDELEEIICRIKPKYIAMDIETDSLKRGSTIIQIGVLPEDYSEVLIIREPSKEDVLRLLSIFDREVYNIVLHNAAYDISVLQMAINEKSACYLFPIVDTMMLASIDGRHNDLSLKRLVFTLTQRPSPLMVSASEERFSDPLYLAEDVGGTMQVFHVLRDKVDTPAWDMMRDLIHLFAGIRCYGVYVDKSALRELDDSVKREVVDVEVELTSIADINWSSPQQVSNLFKKMGAKGGRRTSTGNLSVSAESVEEMLSRVDQLEEVKKTLELLVRYNKLRKLRDAFIEPYFDLLGSGDYLYPQVNYAHVETGRLACSNPNLQQVDASSRLKGVFRSRFEGGYILECDLSQAELRVAALLSGDETLASVLQSKDIHRLAASVMFNKSEDEITPSERKVAKTVVFGSLYGGTPYGLAMKTGISVEDAERAYRELFRFFGGLGAWMEEQKEFVLKYRYQKTIFGRIRRYRDKHDDRSLQRMAVNTPIQSVASDINLWILRHVFMSFLERGLQSKILVPVHDAIIVDVHPDELVGLLDIFHSAYLSVGESPVGKLPLYNKLPILGELTVARSWGECSDKTSLYNPLLIIELSSHEGIVRTEKKNGVIK